MQSELCTDCRIYQIEIKDDWNLQPIKIYGQYEVHARKFTDIIFYSFPLLIIF